MNQECIDVRSDTNDLTIINCQKWQKDGPRRVETIDLDSKQGLVYNECFEGGGMRSLSLSRNGIEMYSDIGENHVKRKTGCIEDRIESSVCPEAKDRIAKILNDINRLSDVEKLLLYLKLPTGTTSQEEEVLRQTPTTALHSSNRAEQAHAFTWIRSHLEEDNEICVPKHEVFDDYKEYCDNHDRKSLCPADFGKVMKCVFPNVKARRLGQRGQSRYCYSGLRKKLEVQPPALPELEVCPRKVKDENSDDDELFLASCQLVCEWAQKLLGSSFNSLIELSEYLVINHYVNSKSMAAFTVYAAMQETGTHHSKVSVSMLFSSPSQGNKHRETQIQLQRKLQEREILKEQKKILQQQKIENELEHEQLLQNKGIILSQKQTKQSFQVKRDKKSPHNEGRSRSLSESCYADNSANISNGRNTVDIAVLSSTKHFDCSDSVCSDSVTIDNSVYHNSFNGGCHDKSRSSSASSTSSSQHQSYNTPKSSVIQIVGQNSTDGKHVHVESQAMDTNEKEQSQNLSDIERASENSIFILPSNTPSSRSAFVPVSNQRKETAFLNDPSSGTKMSEKVQNEHEMQESLRSDVQFDPNPSLQTAKKPKNRFTPKTQTFIY